MGRSARQLTIGLAAGGFMALIAGRGMQSMLFGVSPADPVTFFSVSGLLAAVALLACYLPAQRASRIVPVTALRTD